MSAIAGSGLLEGHRILITGAARGIGLALAKAAHAHGARVVLADIDHDECVARARDLAGAMALGLDVADDGSIRHAAAGLELALGGLDGLVNNAAMPDESNAATVAPEQINRVMSVNGTSVLRVSQAMLPLLQQSRHPSIVNTLSTQAFFGQPYTVAYGAAKGAALALTRLMAVDFAPHNIRVNGVAPGFIDTRMAVTADGVHEHDMQTFRTFYAGERKIPMGRGGTAEECAGAFLYLLSELSSYVTGQVIAVDGGLTATY